MGFWDFLDKRVKGQEDNIPWFVNDKLKAHKFYIDNDIPTPRMIEVYNSHGDINLSKLPDSFCIKPSNMHSSAGVMPLSRIAEGRYYDKLRKRVISEEGVLREQLISYENCKFKSSYRILVEEGLGHQKSDFLIPFDYKLYSFKVGVGLILQVDRNSDKPYFSFLDGNGDPLRFDSTINTSKKSISYYGHPQRPEHIVDMIKCAGKIPELLGTPFVSVDMYSTKKGFFVGEITPAPGGPYYKDMFELLPEIDSMLGKMWADFYR
ncbi:hypothetical protein NHG85_13050 [Limimaricola sp. ASW11-118]|uniref:TupA-like ATPgrasp n=1 Tax=Limimaricola litoreus TaxID=2955316 RepID=A0A9X2JPC8_9RHOB|nr:ATP-grasp fold amidoligase family protein [Limimaricola litoreus]MCP1169438.1 hypothetical protein [Limimaricola litoreus]